MPGPKMPSGIRAIVYTQTPRRTCQNILYYEPTVAPSHQKHMQAIADQIDVHFRSAYQAVMVNSAKFRGVMAYYSAAGTDVAWQAWSSGGTTAGSYASGSNNIDVMPDEDVAIIRKITGKKGREDQGRLYISGMPEAGNINGELEVAYGNTLIALANKVPQSIAIVVPDAEDQPPYEATLNARHWNRKDNLLRPITACLITSTVMQQRRRRRPLIGLPASVTVETSGG